MVGASGDSGGSWRCFWQTERAEAVQLILCLYALGHGDLMSKEEEVDVFVLLHPLPS